ncbi:hypothetical protein LI951_04685 [Enterococcus sp. BWT-B8]|uniref:hypothetical protein n=1 Tax=Enterococcus sp. BWT-B8 TaxID=2885157 RepID=UPI001E649169|nr:hypothetical protein [Enterococcus sp. BWT-B8]MCB5951355.1 hypothetical protein [Enterococcus sp. BWT-B8]
MDERTNNEKIATQETVNIKLSFSKDTKIINQRWYKKMDIRKFLKSIFSRLLTIILTLVFAVPATYHIQELLKINKEEITYKVDFDAKHISENEIELERGYGEEYKYSFGTTLNLNISSGSLQYAYLVYTKHDNEEISRTDFHKLDFDLQSNLNACSLLDITIRGVSDEKILANAEISTELSYGSMEQNKVKDIYLLTIDNQNNSSVVLFTVQGTHVSQQLSGNGHSILSTINPTPCQSPVKFEQINSFDFLDVEVPNNISESFVKNKKQIVSICSDFTSFK